MKKEKKLLSYEKVKLDQISAGALPGEGCTDGAANGLIGGCVQGNANTVDGSRLGWTR